eukprot:2219816-Alexandrium_andersonii.AAC.1
MSASLVGSEMCIRDRRGVVEVEQARAAPDDEQGARSRPRKPGSRGRRGTCLLYTSDAADDM